MKPLANEFAKEARKSKISTKFSISTYVTKKKTLLNAVSALFFACSQPIRKKSVLNFYK